VRPGFLGVGLRRSQSLVREDHQFRAEEVSSRVAPSLDVRLHQSAEALAAAESSS
jgi:hypothetical protein